MKRTTILIVGGLLAILAVGCSEVDKTKLEPVYRSAKAVEASTGAGITFAQFTPLVQTLTTEVAIARDKASTSTERALVDNYGKAATMYQDSATLWGLKIQKGPILSEFDAPAIDLATKYGIPRKSTGNIDADEGLQTIWSQASVWLQAGNVLYTGKTSS